MKAINKIAVSVVVVVLIVVTVGKIAESAWERDVARLDAWANAKIESVFAECTADSRIDLFKALKRLERDYADEIGSTPLAAIVKMKTDSTFTQLGEVVFPERLPRRYPFKGAFLICSEVHHEFQLVVKPEERKQRLEEMKSCLSYAYKDELPAVAKKMLDCYSKF